MEFSAGFLAQINQNTLYRSVGIRVVSAEGGRADSKLEVNPDLCWPFPGQPHGGVLFTLMDTTMAWAAVSRLDEGQNCTTIHLDIDYTAPASKTAICRAEVSHRTKRTLFLRGEVRGVDGALLALGQGTFRVIAADMPKI
jgi:uncharacterized protein (TIGR00369 family)